jgi:hypothetical protein
MWLELGVLAHRRRVGFAANNAVGSSAAIAEDGVVSARVESRRIIANV